MDPFRSRFNFDPGKHLFIGVERECFLTREGKILPIAPEIIPELPQDGSCGYELSACQLEMRTAPSHIDGFYRVLKLSDDSLKRAEKTFGFKGLHQEVAPDDMPLDIYPDPTGRYQEITKDMSLEVLRAACIVTGTHIHIGMKSPEDAITAYNEAIKHLPELCEMGDKSGGKRLELYKIVAPDFKPPRYDTWSCYERYATEHGFQENPRNCWHMIRISIHGTIEFRMFGSTPEVDEIANWGSICHALCKYAL